MLQANHSYGFGRVKKKDLVNSTRIRREGGGRAPANEKFNHLDEVFLSAIAEHIAGDPMNEKIKWVKLTRHQISLLMNKRGVSVSRNIVRKLLKKHGFVKRKMQRKKSTGQSADRDRQFHHMTSVKKKFMNSGNPIISIDTKKKEKLGNLHRDGTVYCTRAIETYDHDYVHLSTGTIVPHGVYDMKRNEAFIHLGVKNETAEFIGDSIKKWWKMIGSKHDSDAKELLIFCDAGGANSYRHHRFKAALQDLANTIGLPIRLCHYPPYASKWNPIEHQVFPHVTRAMAGIKLESIEEAKELIKKAETSTGLKVLASITKKIYKTGIKIKQEVINKINIKKHGRLGYLNYTVSPAVT